MGKKYKRASLDVEAVKYELGKDMEDGFESWTKVVTNGWISAEGLIKVTKEDGRVVCPFIKESGERHCCGEDKFSSRFSPVE